MFLEVLKAVSLGRKKNPDMRIITLLILVCSLCSNAQNVGLIPYATGFYLPTDVVHAGDERLFLVEREGRIKIINPGGETLLQPFLDISTLVNPGGEGGFLGLAFDPDYADNGYFYVKYWRQSDAMVVVARYSVSTDPNLADPASEMVLLTIPHPIGSHFGGTIAFGPDGYLYISSGDGGTGGATAQDITSNLGKILRLDVNAPAPYIPAGNPYVGTDGNDEIWALGFRNPWKFSFDQLTGDLWIGDVGQAQIEEINRISQPLSAGLNFGWRCFEGLLPYSGECSPSTIISFPFLSYSHLQGCAVTGGYVYRGSLFPSFYGKYFFADFCSGTIGRVDQAGLAAYTETWPESHDFTTFAQDVNGELYLADSHQLYKIVDLDLATEQFEASQVSISPNPATDTFSIYAAQMRFPAKLQLFDLCGKLLLEQTLTDQNSAVITEMFERGLYLVKVLDYAGKQFDSKITIK
jgi:glucose/arabinose dehydrogenase